VPALTIRRQYPSVSVMVRSPYVELGLAMQLLSESAEGVGYLLGIPSTGTESRRVLAVLLYLRG
jgi:hypothetical protein